MGLLVSAVPLLLVLAGLGFQFGGPLAVLTGKRMVRLVGRETILTGYQLWLLALAAVPVVTWIIGIVTAATTIWQGAIAFGVGMSIPLALAAALSPWLLLAWIFLGAGELVTNS